jgi:hypothetical protein
MHALDVNVAWIEAALLTIITQARGEQIFRCFFLFSN